MWFVSHHDSPGFELCMDGIKSFKDALLDWGIKIKHVAMVHQECVRGWGYSNSLNTCKPPCNLLQSTVCCPCVLWRSFYAPVRWEGSNKLFLMLHLLPSSKMFFFNVCNRVKYVFFQDIFWVWQKKNNSQVFCSHDISCVEPSEILKYILFFYWVFSFIH